MLSGSRLHDGIGYTVSLLRLDAFRNNFCESQVMIGQREQVTGTQLETGPSANPIGSSGIRVALLGHPKQE